MKVKTDVDQNNVPGWTVKDDPRKTKFGSFLRKTSLDELPQLWNVFVGDMSLVGPRPEQTYYVEKFRHEIPAYMLRHKMKAGITGWAQVNGWRGDTSLHDEMERVPDLLGGQVNYMFDSITSARPHIESGKLRALGLTTAKRSKSLPNVPTLAEAGLPGYEVSPWFAVFMPAATPKDIVAKVNAAVLEAMKDPDVVKRFETIGAEPVGSTPEEMAQHLARESERWTKLIQERGIKLD